jgi:hypothetical protein
MIAPPTTALANATAIRVLNDGDCLIGGLTIRNRKSAAMSVSGLQNNQCKFCTLIEKRVKPSSEPAKRPMVPRPREIAKLIQTTKNEAIHAPITAQSAAVQPCDIKLTNPTRNNASTSVRSMRQTSRLSSAALWSSDTSLHIDRESLYAVYRLAHQARRADIRSV